MATATKKCKVCGKEYEYCHTIRKVAGVFRWQDVACSVEHGEMYLASVLASRMEGNEPAGANADVGENQVVDTGTPYIDDCDDNDIDELFDTDFDEDDL